MTFESDLERYARRVGKSLDETCRSITIKWFSSTIRSTPVDTGRLMGNWQASQDAPMSGVTADVDKVGNATISKFIRKIGGAGSVNYLVNNLDYAEKIEYGGSDKAPEGMVRKNHARILRIVKQSAAENQV